MKLNLNNSRELELPVQFNISVEELDNSSSDNPVDAHGGTVTAILLALVLLVKAINQK